MDLVKQSNATLKELSEINFLDENGMIDSEKVGAFINILSTLDDITAILKEKKEELKENLKESKLYKLDLINGLVTVTEPTTREQFDKKKFRAEHPELYDEYIEIVDVKSSIRIKAR